MVTAIKIPDLGTTTDEITLIEWLKQEGDPVKRGESLCEVETDKATDQLESVAEGVLLRQVVPAGSQITSGTVIGYVGQPGESVAEPPSPLTPLPHAAEGSSAVEPCATVPKVPPVVRNLAKREGVDLDSIAGTGPGGRITREDVLKAKQTADAGRQGGMPLAKEQLPVARQVARSNREIPTIDLTTTVAMSAVIRARKQLEEQSGEKVAYDSYFLFAVAQGIKRFPVFAGHATDDRFFQHDSIDVCVAVSREEKLYLPVVRSADALSLVEFQAEVRRLVEKTRGGRLRSDDLAGGCFTVSNLGMYAIDSFQMIIPPQQSGALAIGAIRDQPSLEDGKVVARPVCTVVLSVDHRMINGAVAADFLRQLKETLEML